MVAKGRRKSCEPYTWQAVVWSCCSRQGTAEAARPLSEPRPEGLASAPAARHFFPKPYNRNYRYPFLAG